MKKLFAFAIIAAMAFSAQAQDDEDDDDLDFKTIVLEKAPLATAVKPVLTLEATLTLQSTVTVIDNETTTCVKGCEPIVGIQNEDPLFCDIPLKIGTTTSRPLSCFSAPL